MKKTYAEKLRDPRWQKKRLEVMQRDGFTCQVCNCYDRPLSVHHRYYISGRNPWEYPGFTLRTLCESCHEDSHDESLTRDEHGEKSFEEWEYELDWITSGGKNHEIVGQAWYVMAELYEGLKSCADSRAFLKKVEHAICEISAVGKTT